MSKKRKKGGCFKIFLKGVVVLFAICVFFAVAAELGTEKPKASKPVKNISHEVIKIIPYDTPVKTQFEYQVLLKQKASKKELRKLLEDLYKQASAKGGFKYHGGKATHIFIYIYPTAEHSDDQWIGMMSKVGKDSQAKYTLKESFFTQSKTKADQSKEEVRKSVFKELILAEWKATALAEETFPVAKPSSPNYDRAKAVAILDKQIDKQRSLLLDYRKAIAKLYSITLEDLSDITMEGVENSWPRPKRR